MSSESKTVRLPGLKLQSKLGATTYRGVHIESGCNAVVRLLPSGAGPDKAAVTRLSDPLLVRILDVGDLKGRRYVVTEFVDGTPLDRLMSHGRLSISRTLSIMRQAIKAVGVLHAHKLKHGALRPGSFMLTREGRVKLIDFGRSAARAQADLAGLGAVFYEMLSGKPVPDKLPASGSVPGIPAELEALTMHILAGRFGSTDEALKALASVVAKVCPAAGQGATTRRVAAPPTKRRWVLPAAVGAVVLLAFVTAAVVFRDTPPVPEPEPPTRTETTQAPHDEPAPEPEPEPVQEPEPEPEPQIDLAESRDALKAFWSGEATLGTDDVARHLRRIFEHPERAEAEEAIAALDRHASELDGAAGTAMAEDRLDDAREAARRMQARFPIEPWLSRAAALLKRADERAAELAATPEPPPAEPAGFGEPERIEFGFESADAVFSEDGLHLLMIDNGSGEFVKFNLDSRQEEGRIDTARGACAIVQRGGRAFVACPDSAAVLVIDPAGPSVVKRISIANGKPSGIAAPSEDPGRFYAADQYNLWTIDSQTFEILDTFDLKKTPGGSSGLDGRPVFIAVNPTATFFHVWRMLDGNPGVCMTVMRDSPSDPLGPFAGRGVGLSEGPYAFDAHGQFVFIGNGYVTDPGVRTIRMELGKGCTLGFHKSLPWGVGVHGARGRVFLYDIQQNRVVLTKDVGGDLKVPIGDTHNAGGMRPGFGVLIHPDARSFILIPRAAFYVPPELSKGTSRDRLKFAVRMELPAAPEGGGPVAFTSIPPIEAYVGYSWTFKVDISDTSAEVMLADGPSGMVYDVADRTLRWTPKLHQIASHPVRLVARRGTVAGELSFRVTAGLKTIRVVENDPSRPLWFSEVRVSSDGDTLYAVGQQRQLMVVSLATEEVRVVSLPESPVFMTDTGSRILVKTAKAIYSVNAASGDSADRVVDLAGDFEWNTPLHTDGSGLMYMLSTSPGIAYYKVAVGGKPRPVHESNIGYGTWTVDPSGKRLFGLYNGQVESFAFGGEEAEWRRSTPLNLPHGRVASPRSLFKWLPDGKRLCVGDWVLNAEDGAVLAHFEGMELEPDPTGGYLAGWTEDQAFLFEDQTFKEVGVLPFWRGDVKRVIPVRKHGRLILDMRFSIVILPVDFAALKP